ncbi:MAG: tetratricopeptide repeat protein, partial [Actinocatenispora sp.]
MGTRSSRSRSSARGRLGAGLVDVPPVPLRDPATAVMSDPQVSEARRYCTSCNEPVGRGRDGSPGRTEGFCPHCGTRFSFLPGLASGDVVDDRYEILGCLAYGGLGWIYLARDRHVSDGGADRWVVLKGLINSADPDAMESAEAERRFLVEVDHPNIIKIHDFARHPDQRTGELVGYIVMEYVGGQSLKDLAMAHRGDHGQREPLPLPQVLAYGLEVLPALGYLHDRGVVYCDFKPDNVIQAEEQLKLIDLGAVRRIDDQTGAIYGTPGYQAPDVATHGPTVGSDLYTVGRALAVLSFQFSGFSTRYAEKLPEPSEVDLFAREQSFHRLLCRATHPDPAYRFDSAASMADQLLGVLREVLSAADNVPRPSVSTMFTAERQAFGTVAGSVSREGPGDDRLDSREVAELLPLPLVDPADPAAGFLATLNTSGLAETVTALRTAPVYSLEVALRLVRANLQLGDIAAADTELARWDTGEVDWRYDWHRGLRALVVGAPQDALASFTAVACALPGEPAAQLAEGAAAELADSAQLAIARYLRVWRVDRGFVSAAFGLARLLLRHGDRISAVTVLDEVPDSSSRYVPAQVAAVRARLDPRPGAVGEPDLLDASARLERLTLDPGRQAQLAVEVFGAALHWIGVSAE